MWCPEKQEALDALELESQTVVRYHIGAGNVTPGPVEGQSMLLIAVPSLDDDDSLTM